MGKTVVGESKTLVEFDSEQAFTQLYFRADGVNRFTNTLFRFFRGKVEMKFPIELIKGARIVAFIKGDDSNVARAYVRFLTATKAAAVAEPIKAGVVKDATDTEQKQDG